MQSRGGLAKLLLGSTLRISAHLCRQQGEGPAPAEIAAALRPRLGAADRLATTGTWRGTHVTIETTDPRAALRTLVSFAQESAFEHWVQVAPVDRLVQALARIAADTRPRTRR